MPLLLLIPAGLAGTLLKAAVLVFGLIVLVCAVAALTSGAWLRFRWVNLWALTLSGVAALIFRLLSHAAHFNTLAKLLFFVSLAVAGISAWRAYRLSVGDASRERRIRKRKRKKRSRIPGEPPTPPGA